MLIAARNAMMVRKRLPYDAEVEYLESTGTQYVDTGIALQNGLDFEVVWKIGAGNLGGSSVVRFGVIGSSVPHLIQCNYDASINTINYWACWSSTPLTDSPTTKYQDAFVKSAIIGNNVYVDDQLRATQSRENIGTSSLSFFLFLRNGNGAAQSNTHSIFKKSARLWKDGILVRDFIPVRFTNEQSQTEGAMYDMRGVGGMNPDGSPRTDGLYRNRGTGAFVIGPDI